MATDSEIGRVVAVDTAQVSIELNRDLKGMSRNTYEDALKKWGASTLTSSSQWVLAGWLQWSRAWFLSKRRK